MTAQQYLLYPRRHGQPIPNGTTPEQLAKMRVDEMRDWKRRFIIGLHKKFPQASIEGFRGDGFIVTLPSDSREYLAALQRELDCVFQIAQEDPPKDLRALLYRGAK